VSVVVSDTSPLHYLILCGVDSVLPRLFEQVIIPPTVFAELHVRNYAAKYLPLCATDASRKRGNTNSSDICELHTSAVG
jgi:hypothetical protein